MRSISTADVSCFKCGSSEYRAVGTARDWDYETCSNSFDYVACKNCEHIYLKNRPTLEMLPIIYPQSYSSYNYNEFLGPVISRIRGFVQKLKVDSFRKYAAENTHIVDVGCGSCELLRIIQKFGDSKWKLTGVDFSDYSAKRLEELGINSIQNLFEEIDLGKYEKADIIVMNQVIEHVENPSKTVAKARDFLNEGGVLIMETPSIDSWDYKLFKKSFWGGWHCPRHWNLFSPSSLRQVCESAGLEVVEISFTLNPYAWLHSFQNLVIEKFGSRKFGKFFSENNFVMLVFASSLDLLQKLLTGKTSNMRIVARKGAS